MVLVKVLDSLITYSWGGRGGVGEGIDRAVGRGACSKIGLRAEDRREMDGRELHARSGGDGRKMVRCGCDGDVVVVMVVVGGF